MAAIPDCLICDLCSKTFTRKYNLRTHIENCHFYSQSHCDVCNISFNGSSGLQKHLERGHNSFGQGFPECDLCGRIFTRKQNLLSHMITVHLQGSQIKCDKCEKTFTTERNLKRHDNQIHNPNTQFPTCNECNKVFKMKHSLVAHIQSCHLEDFKNNIAKCNQCNKIYTNHRNLKRHIETLHGDRISLFHCTLCPKVYTSNQSLRRHNKSSHNPNDIQLLKCTQCDRMFVGEHNLEIHVQSMHTGYTYVCNRCNETFNSEDTLQRHIIEFHNQESWLKCFICNKQFVVETYLRHHVKTEHSFQDFYKYCKDFLLKQEANKTEAKNAKKKPADVYFNCEFCSLVFNIVTELKEHMRYYHSKTFTVCNCNVCFTKFYSKETLLEHKKFCLTPSNANPCLMCDKLFTDVSSLEFHIKIFHPLERDTCDITSTNADETDDAYKCDHCNRIYNSDRSLKHHIKLKHTTDEAVECNVCGKLCNNKYYLASHLKIVHTSETISKCDYCDKQFKSKRNIRRHIEFTHLGMQRYKCIECETLFKEKRSLRKHVRSKHPNSNAFPQCHICYKRFESAKSCKIHLKLVHSYNLNTHPCDLCSVSFSSYQALHSHLRTNHLAEDEIYKCEDCNEVFKGQENFDHHNELYHLAPIPQIKQKILPRCIICIKDFSTRKTLKRHIKKFHQELDVDDLVNYGMKKRFFNVECDECIKKFNDDFYYNIYLKLKHLKESIIFQCESCKCSYNSIEYSIQRYKIKLFDDCKSKMIISDLCTTEMSLDENDSEMDFNFGFDDIVMEPESTTDIKEEPFDLDMPDEEA